MKKGKIFRILSVALVLSMLATSILTTPAFAAFLQRYPESGPPGTLVSLAGSGFHAGDQITITFGGQQVATDIVGPGGAVNTILNVPFNKPRGIYLSSRPLTRSTGEANARPTLGI